MLGGPRMRPTLRSVGEAGRISSALIISKHVRAALIHARCTVSAVSSSLSCEQLECAKCYDHGARASMLPSITRLYLEAC